MIKPRRGNRTSVEPIREVTEQFKDHDQYKKVISNYPFRRMILNKPTRMHMKQWPSHLPFDNGFGKMGVTATVRAVFRGTRR